eukprot:TRINITY_DN9479_c0_g1_i2.p1 TRINITY_DN9479_c0_g1~~TRINITY_DN9479_c0_g1_i2.p1  ORF type:complete len:100 (-),score=18.84 TRINITY_DN9479_c0_g1_i2:319-618(-)
MVAGICKAVSAFSKRSLSTDCFALSTVTAFPSDESPWTRSLQREQHSRHSQRSMTTTVLVSVACRFARVEFPSEAHMCHGVNHFVMLGDPSIGGDFDFH